MTHNNLKKYSLRSIVDGLKNVLFPPICLCCEEAVCTSLFCRECAAFFELADLDNRCPSCFAEQEGRGICPACRLQNKWGVCLAMAVDESVGVYRVIHKFRSKQAPYLAKTLASFLFVQFERLGWQQPHLIVPIPQNLFFQKTDSSNALAHALSAYLNVPVKQCLGIQFRNLLAQRINRPWIQNFYLKEKANIEGKILLLVDDLANRDAVQEVVTVLKEGFFKKLLILAFSWDGKSSHFDG